MFSSARICHVRKLESLEIVARLYNGLTSIIGLKQQVHILFLVHLGIFHVFFSSSSKPVSWLPPLSPLFFRKSAAIGIPAGPCLPMEAELPAEQARGDDSHRCLAGEGSGAWEAGIGWTLGSCLGQKRAGPVSLLLLVSIFFWLKPWVLDNQPECLSTSPGSGESSHTRGPSWPLTESPHFPVGESSELRGSKRLAQVTLTLGIASTHSPAGLSALNHSPAPRLCR